METADFPSGALDNVLYHTLSLIDTKCMTMHAK